MHYFNLNIIVVLYQDLGNPLIHLNGPLDGPCEADFYKDLGDPYRHQDGPLCGPLYGPREGDF